MKANKAIPALLFCFLTGIAPGCKQLDKGKIWLHNSEFNNDEIEEIQFEICLFDRIKYPNSKKLKFTITFENGKMLINIYDVLLSPQLDSVKSGQRCYIVGVYDKTIHNRHISQIDIENINLLKNCWNRDSIKNIEVVVYKSSYSDKIYDRALFTIN